MKMENIFINKFYTKYLITFSDSENVEEIGTMPQAAYTQTSNASGKYILL